MMTRLFFLGVLVLCAACEEDYDAYDAYDAYDVDEPIGAPGQSYGSTGPVGPGSAAVPGAVSGSQRPTTRSTGIPSAASAGAGLKLHPFYDQQGMVSVKMPFPESWQVHTQRPNGSPSITGPQGLKIYDFPPVSFMYTNDPQMQQVYGQSGQQLRPMPDLQTLIQQDVVPWASQQGLTLVRNYEVPEVQRIDDWYQRQLFQAVPMQKRHAALGIEFKAQDGSPFFLLMHIGESQSAGLQTWFYYSNGLQADGAYFEQAKQQFIYALANAQYNPMQIQAYNQREAQKSGQSWAAHNARMRSKQASFEATQRAIVDANNAVSDGMMSSWRERNAMQDRSQSQFVDAMAERTTMVDPSSGQAWEVDSGANNYWINQDGEYFTTEDYNYNPNVDPSMYDQQWQQMQAPPQ
ncbi:MAG: hypothetical protein AAF648_09430 [Pseudomonadota bacterium]